MQALWAFSFTRPLMEVIPTKEDDMIAKRTIQVSRWNRAIEKAQQLEEDVHWTLIDAPSIVGLVAELPFRVAVDVLWTLSPKVTLAEDTVEIH